MTETARIDAQALDALFAPYDRDDAPGIAVGIAAAGQASYRRAFGLASVELAAPLTTTMRLRIGSTSKHFTALAIMMLAEQGRLDLADTPRRFLPELPDWASSMTIEQLLTHTSGMRDCLDLLLHSAEPGNLIGADALPGMLSRIDSVNFAPGSSWSYNNGGYLLLSLIVERVSGQAFGDFLRTRIFEPIGMADTALKPLDNDLLPNSATLHVPRPDGGWRRGYFGCPILGEGGIVSTVEDMLAWLRHMDAPRIGSAESWARIRHPVTSHGYGLGLFIDRRRGLDVVHHAGTVIGGACQMVKIVEPNLDIVVLTNGHSSLALHHLVDAIIASCIPELPPEPIPAPGASPNGTYYSDRTGRVIGLQSGPGDAPALRISGMTLPALRDQDGSLSVPFLPSDLCVQPAADGAFIDIAEFGARDRLELLDKPLRPAIEDLAGRYGVPAIGMSATITPASQDEADMQITGEMGHLGYRLRQIGEGLWEATSTGSFPLVAMLEMVPTGFLLSTGRTNRLLFERLP